MATLGELCPDNSSGGGASTVSPQRLDSDQAHDLFECGICTEELNVPKALPCLHNYCLGCLEKYFASNRLSDGAVFQCPSCRKSTTIPAGGPAEFPTNFHVERIRQCNRKLDLSYTLREAMEYLETREEEITEELGEHRRRTLVAINAQREEILARVEEHVEGLRVYVEDQFLSESTRAVDVVQTLKRKLVDLNNALGEETAKRGRADTPNVLRKLKRQAEIISNIANEMEELKSQADDRLQVILDKQLGFAPGDFPYASLDRHFGVLHRSSLRRKASLENLNLLNPNGTSGEPDETGGGDAGGEGFSVLSVTSWSQSWSILVLGILPAVLFGLLLKLIYTVLED